MADRGQNNASGHVPHVLGTTRTLLREFHEEVLSEDSQTPAVTYGNCPTDENAWRTLGAILAEWTDPSFPPVSPGTGPLHEDRAFTEKEQGQRLATHRAMGALLMDEQNETAYVVVPAYLLGPLQHRGPEGEFTELYEYVHRPARPPDSWGVPSHQRESSTPS